MLEIDLYEGLGENRGLFYFDYEDTDLNKQAIITWGQSANYETGVFGKIFLTEHHNLDSNPNGSYNFDKAPGRGIFL